MKVCQIYYDASHYRETIYRAIDEAFDCDSYFGLPPAEGVKQLKMDGLRGDISYTKIKTIGSFFYQNGILPLIWKPYDVYLGLGETHGISTWLFAILVRLFKPKKRVYFWSHGWYGKETGIQKRIKKIFFKLPNGGTFVYGDYARNLMINEGLSADKIFVIHNSLAYPQQLEQRNSIKSSDIYCEHFHNKYPILIMIGRLNMRKHLDMLVKAVSQLKQRGCYYNIVLIGDGEDRGKLESLVSDMGLQDQVWFYGACYDEKVNAELLYNADMCVVPGDIGLTAIHSMMFGTPVVSHNHFPFQGPEFEAIKPGETGDFFEHGNVDSLSQTIQAWFSSHVDREAVRKMCYEEIDSNWTPTFQIQVLKEHLK